MSVSASWNAGLIALSVRLCMKRAGGDAARRACPSASVERVRTGSSDEVDGGSKWRRLPARIERRRVRQKSVSQRRQRAALARRRLGHPSDNIPSSSPEGRHASLRLRSSSEPLERRRHRVSSQRRRGFRRRRRRSTDGGGGGGEKGPGRVVVNLAAESAAAVGARRRRAGHVELAVGQRADRKLIRTAGRQLDVVLVATFQRLQHVLYVVYDIIENITESSPAAFSSPGDQYVVTITSQSPVARSPSCSRHPSARLVTPNQRLYEHSRHNGPARL